MTVYSRAGVGQLDVYPLLPEYGSKELQYLYEEYGTKPDVSVSYAFFVPVVLFKKLQFLGIPFLFV